MDNTARLISGKGYGFKEALLLIRQENYTQYGAVLSCFTDQWTNDLVQIKCRDANRRRKGQPDLNHCSGLNMLIHFKLFSFHTK
jgi:hypothetical protein